MLGLGPRPGHLAVCHAATAHPSACALLRNYCDLAQLRAPRAARHPPFARAFLARGSGWGGGLPLLQLCPAKWRLPSKHLASKAQEARCWHPEVPPPCSPSPTRQPRNPPATWACWGEEARRWGLSRLSGTCTKYVKPNSPEPPGPREELRPCPAWLAFGPACRGKESSVTHSFLHSFHRPTSIH